MNAFAPVKYFTGGKVPEGSEEEEYRSYTYRSHSAVR